MSTVDPAVSLEEQIDQWRSYLRRRQAILSTDIAELEDHLREQVASLVEAGLVVDEAFLVAVKRLGELDALSREFAREHSDRLWKQLVAISPESVEGGRARTDAVVVVCLALAAAVAIKIPVLFGLQLDQNTEFADQGAGFYARNLSLFVLPFLAGYFVWKRRLNS
ncbi:MAG TPA: permease prefix domain 1-containing protein, partial [Gammaproteobacteria bacterium]|nr:permease prefix domain 1-containing protein [Gammaproteobacteria bacterium]